MLKINFDSRYEGCSDNFIVKWSVTLKRLGNTDLECFQTTQGFPELWLGNSELEHKRDTIWLKVEKVQKISKHLKEGKYSSLSYKWQVKKKTH